ncbi:hypothetical protein GQ43DRAFT_439763 [Delitschia confertaspora ATCC 74209]|uniref:Uncharacterized protein n=1 Tax=Delitschia confertaspora ATCC 74209 TaxID=1513339 RepID=A0A9P4JTM7_9PLEO|nr:hypothetical protein GQ43DRAFT_439763 [Delitschia confertaspora ATCC 74209]
MPSTTSLRAFQPVFRPLHISSFRPQNTFLRTPQPFLRKPTASSIAAFTSPFSSTARLLRRKKGGKGGSDSRIVAIRYHLNHPLTPRPLRFSRSRFLRHWTIHRAWMLFLRKRRWAEERELERQYMSMRDACETLRLLDESGNKVSEAEAGGQGVEIGKLGPRGKEVGRLYRAAMNKTGVWDSVPIEYARVQVDFPSRDGWNHEWTRA